MQQELTKILAPFNQSHILKWWKRLSPKEQDALIEQIKVLDWNLFKEQRFEIHCPSPYNGPKTMEPLEDYAESGNAENLAIGNTLIEQGKVGCLLVAGGEGTRLGFHGPKGMYPILEDGTTLFEIFAKRIKETKCPIAIMTSPENDLETREFFEKKNYFGLKKGQLYFFMQNKLPFLDITGNLLLENPYTIALGPSGNGDAIKCFVKSGIWQHWKKEGIEQVNFIQVDNPLADPLDPELLGYHLSENADVTVKCIERTDPKEKVGLLMKVNGKTVVTEYSEVPRTEQEARRSDDTLKHQCANISLFCFSMDFIKQVSAITLPLHRAFKKAKCIDQSGYPLYSDSPVAWKYEYFIFDVLPYANKVAVIKYPRSQTFAPLKNKEGADSPETVRQALAAIK